MLIGANPTDAHPVFASRMKKRLRQGAKLIVIDPRRIDLVRTPHVEAAYHLPLLPGTNVAILSAAGAVPGAGAQEPARGRYHRGRRVAACQATGKETFSPEQTTRTS